MELQQMKCFIAVAETLNFTQAAKFCGVSQPALSRAIQKLEDEVGGILIRRERNRTHLTDLGNIILPRLKQSLDFAESALLEAQEFSKISATKLSLGVMCTIGPNRMIPLVEHMAQKVPQLDLKLFASTGLQLVSMLESGEIDVALIGMPEYPDIINAYPLFKERYVVALNKKHHLNDLTEVPLAKLEGEPYLERLNCEFDDHFDAEYSDFPFTMNTRFSSENEEWIQSMILAGLGCAIIPEFSVLQTGLVTRRLIEPCISRTVCVATVRGRPQSESLLHFIRLCRALKWT